MDRDLKERKHPTNKGEWTLHDTATNEPVMSVKPTRWGREVHLEWHPDFKESHPSLAGSHEWGNPVQRGPHNTMKNKSEAISRAGVRYREAARSGFKDKIDIKREHMSDEDFEGVKKEYAHHHANNDYTRGDIHRAADEKNVRTITHYHDPGTGERIITQRFSPVHGKHVYSVNTKYAQQHNIDPDVAKTLTSKHKDLYDKATALMQSKGKQAKLTGKTVASGGTYHTYKVNGSPEEASQAHEQRIVDRNPKAVVTRHSPTSFTAVHEPEGAYRQGAFITSHIMGDTLHTTNSPIHHQDSHSRTANADIIESFVSDPKAFFVSFAKTLREEGEGAPTNSAGGGQIDGIGIGTRGEPGVRKTKYKDKNIVMTNMLKRRMMTFKEYVE